jgi:hypothetical protein
LLKVTQAGAVTKYTNNTLAAPFGVSIDGGNNIFIADRDAGNGTYVAEASNAGAAISPATAGYTLSGQLKGPLNIAMDQSGNAWIAAYEGNMIVEWIGAGLPVYNPLSLASQKNAVAKEP